ncbi:MAG: ROK family glucokinase [Clostridiaceae bacterium]|jgi:glucokinase|nr:ROK family glucokinase [Clostridiaceae bacterium]
MYYIGIDLGGTKIAAGIVDENGKIIKKDSMPTGRTRKSEEIVNDICTLIKKLLNDTNLSDNDIYSVGIGSPGSLDRDKGIIIANFNLSFKYVAIRDAIQKVISVPVYVENDANCAAIAESVAGVAKGVDYAVLITIGTGIGGGIIINNKLYIGSNGAGAELGHVVIDLNGEACTCGRKGCWEAYSSATALIRQTKDAAAKNPSSKLLELVDGDLEKINAKTAFDAAKLGDVTAINVVDCYIDMLVEGLANMVNIFQPDVIAIGGGVSKEGENLLTPLREKMKGRTFFIGDLKSTKIVAAELGNDAGIVGAALISKRV